MHDPLTIKLDPAELSLFQGLERSGQPCLILYTGPDAGRRFDLDGGASLIGRANDAQVLIDAPGISRRHARLDVTGGVVELRDLGSANRTLVNDRPVQDAVTLKDGDLIRLANVVLRFHASRSLDVLLHDRIYRLATVDALTGAFNRRYLHDTMKLEVARARRQASALALICLDLDHFKSVNDRHGHAAGDHVLTTTCELLRAELPPSMPLCRQGGEEFAVLMPQTDARRALEVAEGLRAALAAHGFDLRASATAAPVPHRQTMSAGVAVFGPGMADEEALLAAADAALYAAKAAGRNRVSVAAP
jgi:diguanylate cyclase (GGDEF)-like protein